MGDALSRERPEKPLIILEEAEVRQALAIARRNDPEEIARFVTQVIAKKIEAVLCRRHD